MTATRTIADGEIVTARVPFFDPEQVRPALIRLAWRQRRMSREYRAWSRGPGPADRLAKYAADAKRYAEDARWHFHRALST